MRRGWRGLTTAAEEVEGRTDGPETGGDVEGAEVYGAGTLAVEDGLVRVQSCLAHGCDVGTSDGIVRVVDCAVLAVAGEAAVLVTVGTGEAGNAVVAGRDEDGVTLETQFPARLSQETDMYGEGEAAACMNSLHCLST